MLRELLADAARAGLAFGFLGLMRCPRLARSLGEAVAAGELPRFSEHADLDAALEWCEVGLLGRRASAARAEPPLEAHAALRGLDGEDLRRLVTLAERREWAPRQVVVREGEAAEEFFLLVAGRLSVFAARPSGELHRLATLLPGASFGESALMRALLASLLRSSIAISARLTRELAAARSPPT
jgi:hypothetical protein